MKDEWIRIAAKKVYVDKRNFVCMMYAKHLFSMLHGTIINLRACTVPRVCYLIHLNNGSCMQANYVTWGTI